jgi:hypothetical protein
MIRNAQQCEAELVDRFLSAGKPDSRERDVWVAIGNALVHQRSKRLVPELLKQLRVHRSCNLVPPGAKCEDYSSGVISGMGISNTPYLYRPKGFPPLRVYEFTEKKTDTLVANGPVPIYVRVRELRGRRLALRSDWDEPSYGERQLEWISLLLGTAPDNLPLLADADVMLFWRGVAGYRRDILKLRAAVRGAHRALVHRLRAGGLLAKDARVEATPAVTICVFDHRPRDTEALPEIEGVEVERVGPAATSRRSR